MCFGLEWFESLLIWIIIICGVVALIKLLISFVLPKLGLGAEVLSFLISAFTIVFWVIVCCALVYFIFDLVICLMPAAGHFPRLRG